MKKISNDLYIVEQNEIVHITISAVGTTHAVNASIDGQGSSVPQGSPLDFQASGEIGRTHYLVFLFTFTSNVGGSYQVDLSGSAEGSFSFEVLQNESYPVLSESLTFRVGS